MKYLQNQHFIQDILLITGKKKKEKHFWHNRTKFLCKPHTLSEENGFPMMRGWNILYLRWHLAWVQLKFIVVMLREWKGQQRPARLSGDIEISIINQKALQKIRTTFAKGTEDLRNEVNCVLRIFSRTKRCWMQSHRFQAFISPDVLKSTSAHFSNQKKN